MNQQFQSIVCHAVRFCLDPDEKFERERDALWGDVQYSAGRVDQAYALLAEDFQDAQLRQLFDDFVKIYQE